MPKDYYKILGVEKSASKDEIKRAFHKMAHKYHPDKKGGDEARFKEVNEAYQVLSDDSKRSNYDNFGSAGGGMGGGQSGWDFSSAAGGFAGAGGQGFQFDLGDIFGEFFGGGQASKARRGRDISVDIQVPFVESIFGTQRAVLISKVGVCGTCQGNGAESGTKRVTCKTCDGKGKIHEARHSFLGTVTTARECPACWGVGTVPEKACKTCAGAGVLKKTEEIKIAIPAGIENGEMIRLANQGEAVPHGVSGDLYVRVHVEQHATFRRDGANLVMDLEIKITDALLGAEYPIATLDGDLTVKVPEGIRYGEILRVKGKGVPSKGGKRGDLMIRIIFKTPTKLSRKARLLIEDLHKEGI